MREKHFSSFLNDGIIFIVLFNVLLRSRIQQQMSQLEELETQKTEIADLQQVNTVLQLWHLEKWNQTQEILFHSN